MYLYAHINYYLHEAISFRSYVGFIIIRGLLLQWGFNTNFVHQEHYYRWVAMLWCD
jgi:hypothetical protein